MYIADKYRKTINFEKVQKKEDVLFVKREEHVFNE